MSIITSTAAAALDYWGFRVYADADAGDWQAQSLAFKLWDAAFWLWNFDEFWCRATSDDHPIWSGHCLPNDGFVPTWSQFLPAATANFEVYGGPVHTQETDHFDEYIYAALTTFMHVPPRGGPSRSGSGSGAAATAARRTTFEPGRQRQPVARPIPICGPVDYVERRPLLPDLSVRREPRALSQRCGASVAHADVRHQSGARHHAARRQPGRVRRLGDADLGIRDRRLRRCLAGDAGGRQSRHLLILWRAGLGQRYERLVTHGPRCRRVSRAVVHGHGLDRPLGRRGRRCTALARRGRRPRRPCCFGLDSLLSDEAARSDRRGCRDRNGSMEAEHRRTGRRNARFVAPRERKHRHGGRLCRLGFDATSGEPKWRFDPADGYGAGLYLGEARDGVAFAGSPAGRLYAVNVRTGRLIWSAKAALDAVVGAAAVTVFQPIVAGDSVVAGYSTFGHPMTGGILVVDRGSGRERWRREFPPASPGAATGFGGGPVTSRDLIAAASGDGRIYGFDCSNGQLRWVLPGVVRADGRPQDRDWRALAVSGRTLVAGSVSGTVTAIDLDARTEKWRYAHPDGGSIALRIAADDESVYVPHLGGLLVSVDLRDGTARWQIGGFSDGFNWAPAIVSGNVYAAASRAGLFSLPR